MGRQHKVHTRVSVTMEEEEVVEGWEYSLERREVMRRNTGPG